MTTGEALQPATFTDATSARLVRRIRSEFLEMPGLRLTPAQASKLWDVDRQTSEAILDVLAILGFLVKRTDGAYLRAT
jgi:hypothetical protein